MTMTRKHYREAAETVREVIDNASLYTDLRAASDIAIGLARMFKRDNGRFRYDRFFEACGLDEWGRVLPTDDQIAAHNAHLSLSDITRESE